MDILDSTDDLLEYSAGIPFVHPLLLHDVVEQFPALHVLHHQEEMFGRFDDLVQLDDVGMPDELEDMDLPRDPLHIGYIDNFILLQDLDGHFFASQCMDP